MRLASWDASRKSWRKRPRSWRSRKPATRPSPPRPRPSSCSCNPNGSIPRAAVAAAQLRVAVVTARRSTPHWPFSAAAPTRKKFAKTAGSRKPRVSRDRPCPKNSAPASMSISIGSNGMPGGNRSRITSGLWGAARGKATGGCKITVHGLPIRPTTSRRGRISIRRSPKEEECSPVFDLLSGWSASVSVAPYGVRLFDQGVFRSARGEWLDRRDLRLRFGARPGAGATTRGRTRRGCSRTEG